MKTILILILLMYSVIVTDMVTINQYKAHVIQERLLIRLSNATDLLHTLNQLPTDCQKEIQLIIKHFKK